MLADRHRETIFAAHTHTQPAQPSTIAHYLLAVIEQLERDTARLAGGLRQHQPESARRVRDHRHRLSDRSAIGRARCSGSTGPTGNTYGSIATVDYLLESVSATAILLVGSRPRAAGLPAVVHDGVRLPAARATASCSRAASCRRSGIPVALEHARAIGSKAVGQAQAIMTAVHNTPFGDIVDTEDDLQPLVASMFRDATRTLTLVAAAMRGADFNVDRLASRAGEGGTTLTELADTLVREEDLPFRTAHGIAALLLKARIEDPAASLSDALAKASKALLGRSLDYSDDLLRDGHEPAAFRPGAADAGWPGAGGDRACGRGIPSNPRKRS